MAGVGFCEFEGSLTGILATEKKTDSMTSQEFIARWQNNDLTERAGAQAHFDDLCDLLGVEKPRQPGEYQFEYGAKKASGGDGWADVWKKGCFGWENKKPGRDLKAALKQLTDYAPNLESPPLLVVCDRERIEIHTVFNGYPDEPRTIGLQDIGLAENLQTLRWLFTDQEKLRPLKSTAAITEEAAGTFADLAEAMGGRGLEPKSVAHFLIQCLFCMYAEDEGLLPGNVFTHLLQHAGTDTARAGGRLAELFKAMRKGGDYGDHAIAHFNGGLFNTIAVPSLEKSDLTILATAAAEMDWRAIEPAIFGTLFERGLNPAKRSQLGAHFTDAITIMRLIDPVITIPLRLEWEAATAEIAALMGKRAKDKGKGERTKKYNEADALFKTHLERLKNFRVLDPACGSGNFLYLALKTLKDLEKQANTDAEIMGLQRQIGIEVSPSNVLGLEIEPYAAELARVTVWIGEIQWMRKNGYELNRNPILKPLDTIENRDALIGSAGPDSSDLGARQGGVNAALPTTEAQWPKADVIIGNPPFLGGSKLLRELGETYQGKLWAVFKNRVPGGADLVTYWFEKARAQIQSGKAQRAGLVATNSIRGGANRKVLERILSDIIQGTDANHGERHGNDHIRHAQTGGETQGGGLCTGASGGGGAGDSRRAGRTSDENLFGQRTGEDAGTDTDRFGGTEMDDRHIAGRGSLAGDENLLLTSPPSTYNLVIFNAWGDEPWVNEGAAVRVSLICFARRGEGLPVMLDGKPVGEIYADLTASVGNAGDLDLTQAKPIRENTSICFMGSSKKAAFDIPGDLARNWLKLPNPNGEPNSHVVFPWANGLDIARRPRDMWIIDFGTDKPETEAALYESPFQHALTHVKPEREKNNRESYRRFWWKHAEPRPGMRRALIGITRYIATPAIAKHRLFAWFETMVLPDQQLLVIARSDNATFGVLHSRFHELWALRMGTSLEDRPRYTPTTTFETFPFPVGVLLPGPALEIPPNPPFSKGGNNRNPPLKKGGRGDFDPDIRFPAIAEAAKALNTYRENWLNPPDWVEWEQTEEEKAAGFPPRPVAKPGHEADLKKRTLTNLYNQRPSWLDNAHKTLDKAVAVAYGWTDYTPEWPDEEILKRLLKLNLGM